MLFNTEIAFIDEFIANLKIRGIERIPFDSDEFYLGVEYMSNYFQKNRASLGDVANEVSMLFIKNPFECVYKRFRDAMSAENGSYLSFINPEYVTSVLNLSKEDALYILKKNRSGINNDFVKKCTDEFCQGAKIATEKQ